MNNPSWPGHLIEVSWLKENIGSPQLRIFDATWFLPKADRCGAEEYQQEHLPGALHFDYDQVFHNSASPFPRTFPDPIKFEAGLQDLGLNQDDRVVVYDNNGLFSSPRAWWMLKAIGVSKVGLLNGGLQAWKKSGGLITNEPPSDFPKGNFKANLSENAFIGVDSVQKAIQDKSVRIIDARAQDRFEAAHMPNSDNLPYTDLLEEGRFRDPDALAEFFDERPLVCSCGSGVTACILAFGATLAGHQNISVYDASWSQWGQDPTLPKEGQDISP